MSGLNKVMLIGRLARDPEVKDSKGLQIANLTVVTSKEWKDDNGEKKEKAEFHNIVAFRKTAEIAGKYLTKGSQVYVEGELTTRSWEDDGGNKRYKTEIIANSIQFLALKPKSEAGSDDSMPLPPSTPDNEEIPF